MTDRYFFKMNETVREDQNQIMVDMRYVKGAGFVATAIPCKHDEHSFTVALDADSFGKYKEISSTVHSCNVRTEKAKQAAMVRFTEEYARGIAEDLCETVYKRCGEKLTLTA